MPLMLEFSAGFAPRDAYVNSFRVTMRQKELTVPRNKGVYQITGFDSVHMRGVDSFRVELPKFRVELPKLDMDSLHNEVIVYDGLVVAAQGKLNPWNRRTVTVVAEQDAMLSAWTDDKSSNRQATLYFHEGSSSDIDPISAALKADAAFGLQAFRNDEDPRGQIVDMRVWLREHAAPDTLAITFRDESRFYINARKIAGLIITEPRRLTRVGFEPHVDEDLKRFPINELPYVANRLNTELRIIDQN